MRNGTSHMKRKKTDCNDELGNIGIALQQLIGKSCLINSCSICFGSLLLKEIFIHLLRKTPPVLVMCMRIEVGYHSRLSVTGITLYGLNIAAADLQLQRGAAVAKAVKYNRTQIMICNQLPKQSGDLTFFIGASVFMRNDKSIIGVFRAN